MMNNKKAINRKSTQELLQKKTKKKQQQEATTYWKNVSAIFLHFRKSSPSLKGLLFPHRTIKVTFFIVSIFNAFFTLRKKVAEKEQPAQP